MKKNYITLLLILLCSTMCRAQQSDTELFKQYFGSKDPNISISSLPLLFDNAKFESSGLITSFSDSYALNQPIQAQDGSTYIGPWLGSRAILGLLPNSNLYSLIDAVKSLKDSLASSKNKSIVFDKEQTIRSINEFRSRASLLPTFYGIIDKEFKGNTEKYIDYIFSKSAFLNDECYNKLKKKPSIKKVEKDPYLNYLVSQIMYADMLEIYSATKARWAKLKEITGENTTFDKSYATMSAIYTLLAQTTPELINEQPLNFDGSNNYQTAFYSYLYYDLKQDKLTQKMIEKALNEYIAENPISKDERERLIASVKGNPKYSNIVNSKFDYSAEKYVDHLLSKSILTNANERAKFLKNPSKKKIVNDPGVNYTLTKIKKMK